MQQSVAAYEYCMVWKCGNTEPVQLQAASPWLLLGDLLIEGQQDRKTKDKASNQNTTLVKVQLYRIALNRRQWIFRH